MNKFRSIGIGAAAGAVTGLGFAMVAAESYDNSPERHRTVNECAAALGVTAIKVEVVPADCREFGRGFDSVHTVTTVSRTHSDETELVSRHTVAEYVLPARQNFLNQQVRHYRIDDSRLIFGGGGLISIGAFVGGALAYGRRRDQA